MSDQTDWDEDIAECEHHAEACEICLAWAADDDIEARYPGTGLI